MDHSNEINFQDFRNIPKHIPFDVLYQTINSGGYNASGFQLNISKPFPSAVLSRDIWVEYSFVIRETVNHDIQDVYENIAGTIEPFRDNRLATRSGNIMARCNRHLLVRINGMEMRYQPCHYVDVLSRLHVSNSQSKHEFSASGGCFDSGNHGHRTEHQRREHRNDATRQLPADFDFVVSEDDFNANTNTHYDIFVIDGFYSNGDPTVGDEQDLYCNIRQTYPLIYEFYNPGFSDRFNQTTYKLRTDWNARASPVAIAGTHFLGYKTTGNPNTNEYVVTVHERLPIPLFKMFSTDGVEGVIPNIKEMIIEGRFVNTSLIANLFKADQATNVELTWSLVNPTSCKAYLKWFVPQVEIPQSVSINCPRIDTVVRPFTQGSTNAAAANAGFFYVDTEVHERDISLIAIPDVLLIYAMYDPANYTIDHPDEYQLELLNFKFNMNVSTAKAFGVNSMELYQLWKRNLKHKDSDIIGYNEWRKYCFVAVLKPEDYGIKDPKEFNLPVQLTVTCTARNWWINPTIMAADQEALGGLTGTGTSMQLVVTSIYYRNMLILSPTSAKQMLADVL